MEFLMVNFRVPPIKGEQSCMENAYLLYKYLKVTAPKRCQRPLCWNNTAKLKYFKSLLMNRVEGSFIFIDIETAFLAVSKQYQPYEKSYQFFEELIKKGFKYIVIDGNNRYVFITDLFTDQWLIPIGEYSYVSDATTGKIETFEVVARHRKFSDLPSKVQKAVKSRKSPVSEYSQLDLAGLAEVFENVNSGVPLNRQELRNVMPVDYADLVRELEDDITPLLNILFEKQSVGLKGQEFIVDCLDFVLNGIIPDDMSGLSTHNAINQNSKDQLYKSTADSDWFWVKFGARFKLIQEWTSKMISEEILGSGNSKKITRNSAIQNLLWMLVNGLCPVYDCVKDAMIESEREYVSKEQYPLRYKGADYDDMTFKEACDGMNKECMNIREKVLNDIIVEINSKYNVDLHDEVFK